MVVTHSEGDRVSEVQIGIYTHRWSHLQVRAVEAIARHTKTEQYSILVTQSAGTCHENMNRLWRRFSAPYVVLMDEDVVVLQDNWLKGLIGALEADGELGVVGCSEDKRPPTAVREPESIKLSYRTWIPAYVMAFKRERVPFLCFDEAIPGRMGMTDVDACLQLLDHGLRVGTIPEIVVYHPNRDDDASRLEEARPRVGEQRAWYPEQVAYMRAKWGDLFARTLGAL